MYTVKPTTRFSKDLKRIERRGYKIDLLTAVIKKLAAGEPLEAKFQDHPLKGNYEGCREWLPPTYSKEQKIESRNWRVGCGMIILFDAVFL